MRISARASAAASSASATAIRTGRTSVVNAAGRRKSRSGGDRRLADTRRGAAPALELGLGQPCDAFARAPVEARRTPGAEEAESEAAARVAGRRPARPGADVEVHLPRVEPLAPLPVHAAHL